MDCDRHRRARRQTVEEFLAWLHDARAAARYRQLQVYDGWPLFLGWSEALRSILAAR